MSRCTIKKATDQVSNLIKWLIRTPRQVFNLCAVSIHELDTSSWTTMISCYNQTGCFWEALVAFVLEMQESKVEPNSVTLMCVLRSCTKKGGLFTALLLERV
ncbi:hypothetical protein ACE6H2_012523 [Prunus campanulata]